MESRFAAPLRYLLRTTSRNRAPPPLPAGFFFPQGPGLRCHLAGQPSVLAHSFWRFTSYQLGRKPPLDLAAFREMVAAV